jgi:hypothetical protein
MKEKPRSKSSSTATKRAVRRIMKESIAEVLASTPKRDLKSWSEVLKEAARNPSK